MVQFNLLPDVKQEYVNARRTKSLVVLISFVASAAAIGIMLLLLITVDVVQKKSLHDANNDIKRYSTELKSVPNIDKILTVQNQLNTLTNLHDTKPVVSRTFGYLAQLTPAKVTIGSYTADHTANTMTITGDAPSLDAINVYVDTLKSTTYTTDSNPKSTKAFTSVVLSSFARTDSSASYTLTISFDPVIFDSKSNVTLNVPNIVTSPQQQLFQQQTGSQ